MEGRRIREKKTEEKEKRKEDELKVEKGGRELKRMRKIQER